MRDKAEEMGQVLRELTNAVLEVMEKHPNIQHEDISVNYTRDGHCKAMLMTEMVNEYREKEKQNGKTN